MGEMTEKELIARDRRRDIGAELVRDLRKTSKAGRLYQVKVPEPRGLRLVLRRLGGMREWNLPKEDSASV